MQFFCLLREVRGPEPNFSEKNRVGPNLGILAKMVQNCSKMDLFENISKSVHYCFLVSSLKVKAGLKIGVEPHFGKRAPEVRSILCPKSLLRSIGRSFSIHYVSSWSIMVYQRVFIGRLLSVSVRFGPFW